MGIDWFPLWLSLRVAALSTTVAVVVGLLVAYVLANWEFRGKEALDAAVTLPLVLPPTVLGYYLLVVLGRNSPLGEAYEAVFGEPLVFTWKAAVVAALFHSAPLLIKSARAGLESVDRTYERAARNLGSVGVARLLAGDAAAGATIDIGRRGAGLRAVARGLRHHHHDRRQHPGPDADGGGGHLRCRRGGQRASWPACLVLIISATALVLLWVANRLGPRQAHG